MTDVPTHEQRQALFFSALPAEIRMYILQYCLTADEHPRRRYNQDSIWSRPGHRAPHVIHTDVLRTCRRFHHEGQAILDQHRSATIYFTQQDQRPPGATNPFVLEKQLHDIAATGRQHRIRHLQLFGHLSLLETTGCLQDVFEMQHLHPRNVTLTIRHVDFRDYETDAPLAVNAGWVNACILPNSVQRVVLQVESLRRKAAQVDYLTKMMTGSWTFQRADSTVLSVDVSKTRTERWQGRSTLNSTRWLRDETVADQLDYCVTSLHFRPSSSPMKRARAEDIRAPDSMADPGPRLGPSMHVARAQFDRMVAYHTSAALAAQRRGAVWPMRSMVFSGEYEGVRRELEEMDPTWLFPRMVLRNVEPVDQRFGGQATGYYHDLRPRSFVTQVGL